MFSRRNYLSAALAVGALASTQFAQAQTQTTFKKGSLIGSTFQGSDEPANIQPGWDHLEGVPVPKSKAKVSAYGVDHYEKGPAHMYLFLQKISDKGVKAITWKVLDTLYVSQVPKGKTLEFCNACRNGTKPSNEVFITIRNKVSKNDKDKGYYSIAQMWMADRTTGKFIEPTGYDVRSQMEGVSIKK